MPNRLRNEAEQEDKQTKEAGGCETPATSVFRSTTIKEKVDKLRKSKKKSKKDDSSSKEV